MMDFGKASRGFGKDGIINGYGASDDDEVEQKMIFVPQPRFTLSYLGIAVSCFCPWLLFTSLYAVIVSRVHYEYPVFVWSMVIGTGFGLSGIMYYIAARRYQLEAGPSWHRLNSFTTFYATVLAIIFGNIVFFKANIGVGIHARQVCSSSIGCIDKTHPKWFTWHCGWQSRQSDKVCE